MSIAIEVTAIIEDPRGSTVRHHWDPDREAWITRPHPHSSEPWPASYGYIPDTWNASDGDDLDVLVLARDPLQTGSRIQVRAVGLLRRPDGDDKILAVLIGDPVFGQVQRLAEIPGGEIDAIERWFAAWSEVGDWHDAPAAAQRISRASARSGRL